VNYFCIKFRGDKNIKIILRGLLTKLNLRKSIRYIKENGIFAYFMKVKKKIYDGYKSESIWDNSISQYKKNDFKIYWELLSEVEKYQLKCITGNENLHFFWYVLNYIKENIGERNLHGLSLGCSEGNPAIEMRLIESGIFNKIKVMDIANGLLNKQRAIALKRGLNGIEYIKQDLNKVALEKNAYDLIWAVGTIHHTENLELLFQQINDALKHNGVFVMREYIGPNRLQFTDLQLSIVNEILSILPEKYKKGPNGIFKGTMGRVDLEYLMSMDPSESVRSQDIIQVMKEKLEIVKLAYTGGTILHPLLDGIASNFEKDENANAILKLLILFEKTLTNNSILPSDYVFCIAKKKIRVSK
jgi:SAM-dependent methyltransferase